jgi:uncharacterized protein YkwD
MGVQPSIAKQIVSRRRPLWRLGAVAVFASLLAACASTHKHESRQPAARTSQSPEQIEQEVYGRVNAYRRSRGLAVLDRDGKMNQLAREHSRSMASRAKLGHRGSSRRFRRLQGQPTSLVSFAENVAYNFGHARPGEVAVEGWLRSPGHHRNILRPDDRLTGIGVAMARDGSWYLTQLFGRRE